MSPFRVILVLAALTAALTLAQQPVRAADGSSAAGAESTSAAPAAAKTAASRQERTRQYVALLKQLVPLVRDKKYEESIALTRKMIDLDVRRHVDYCTLACLQARLGQTEDAFASLTKSVELGYSDANQMKTDADLESLRQDPRFDPLVAKAAENADTGAAFPYDKGAAIPGLKTVENVVKDGLRYRLRMNPKATKEKPDHLIVWLHPSGAALDNAAVEKMAPMFSKHGFALVVFTQKDPTGWTEPDLLRMANTVNAIGKIEGLDIRQTLRPILMGYSAGGQAALTFWLQNVGKLGGLILDSAYPVSSADYAQGRIKVFVPPAVEAAKVTPFFVLVGAEDPGAALWHKAQEPWLKSGVPLVVNYVPKAKHQWLFDAAGKAELEKWLTDVAAGKKPTMPPAAEPPAGSDQPAAMAPLN